MIRSGVLLLAAAAGSVAPAHAAAALRLDGPREVAPGGTLRLRAGGLAQEGTLEQRRAGRWRRVRAVPSNGRIALRVRAPARGRLRLRVRGAGGELSNVRAIGVRPLVLAATGDVNLGDVPGRLIAARGVGAPWTSVGGLLREADLAFANLECAVSRRGRPEPKTFTFRGRPAALAGARYAAGLDVVNLANNHARDFGATALLDTLRTARNAGIATVGAGRDARAAYRPRVVRRLGLRVAFVGFSEVLPFGFRAGPGRPGTAWAFPGRIRSAVRAAARRADVVVATFHWGIERDTSASARQRALARIALRAGATAVIGAHPHVLQEVERPSRRRLVAYSLGNFVFGATSPVTARTGVLLVGLGRRRVVDHRLVPARIAGGRPVLLRRAPIRTIGEAFPG